MPNTRQNFAKGMVNDAYDYALEEFNEESMVYPEVFDVESSEGSYEQYTTFIGSGLFTKVAEGASIPSVSVAEGFTVQIANFKYAVEFPLTNEAIDDNRKIKNALKEWAKTIGYAARQTLETKHADVFNKGGFTAGDNETFLNDIPGGVLTTTYGNVAYDSKPFLNLSGNLRTAKHGGTYYNGVSTLDLTETNLQVLYKLLSVTNAYNEAGLKVDIKPNVLLCQTGSDTWFTAKRILESPSMVNAIHSGVENVWKGQLRLIGWPFLTDTNAWFIGVAKKGLKSLTRLPLAIDYYEQKNTDSQIVRAKVRTGKGVTNFRFWAGANFSTS